jgi:hypothetical protein
MLPSRKRHPSANADPNAVTNPLPKPYKDPLLKVKIKIGPMADDTDTPTRKHLI